MEFVALCRTSAARSLRHSNEVTHQLEVGRGVKLRRKYLKNVSPSAEAIGGLANGKKLTSCGPISYDLAL